MTLLLLALRARGLWRTRWGWLTDGDDDDLWLDAQGLRHDFAEVRRDIAARLARTA